MIERSFALKVTAGAQPSPTASQSIKSLDAAWYQQAPKLAWQQVTEYSDGSSHRAQVIENQVIAATSPTLLDAHRLSGSGNS